MKPIRVGIAGSGKRGFGFASLLKEETRGRFTAVYDTNARHMEEFTKRLCGNDIVRAADLDEFLGGDLVDAVIVTVPDRYHREIAVRCLEAGKHVMLEKPMALTVEDCMAIIRAKERSDRVLQIGFSLRCAPLYRKIREVVDSGVLGRIMGITASECLNVMHGASFMRRWHRRRENSGGLLMCKCCHDLDMISWLAGGRASRVASFGGTDFFLPSKRPASHCSVCPERASCRFAFNGECAPFMTGEDRENPTRRGFDLCVYNDDKDIVDNQVVILEYDNGVRATFTVQMFDRWGRRRMTIFGTEGQLVTSDRTFSVLRPGERGSREYDVSGEMGSSGHDGADAPFLTEFLAAAGGDREPVADWRDGLASTVTALAAEESRTTGRVVTIDPRVYECAS